MSVQPTAFSASVAGTQRAATRSGDADAANAQASNGQLRAAQPGGAHDGVEQVERDAAAGDSGADGRQLLVEHEPDENKPDEDKPDEDDAENGDAAPRAEQDPHGRTGGRIDFKA
jgi:hypothetical protein